jgi:hypothetical protein
MNRWQKIAVFNILVIFFSLSFTVGAVTAIGITIGFSKASAGMGFLGFLGLLGLQPVLFRKDKSKVSYDERDALIGRKAVILGFTASYLFFVFACMGCWWYARADGMINVRVLPLIVVVGYMISELFRSTSLLIMYGRGAKEGHNE